MGKYHLIAFFIGFFLDQIIGDPYNIPHPIRLIGSLISFFDKKLLGDISEGERDFKREKRRGVALCILVPFITVVVTAVVVVGAYLIYPYIVNLLLSQEKGLFFNLSFIISNEFVALTTYFFAKYACTKLKLSICHRGVLSMK